MVSSPSFQVTARSPGFSMQWGCLTRNSLGPLLFSLVFMDLMESITLPLDISFPLWYLDDGTFVGSRFAVTDLLGLSWPFCWTHPQPCQVVTHHFLPKYVIFCKLLVVLSCWVPLFFEVTRFFENFTTSVFMFARFVNGLRKFSDGTTAFASVLIKM